MKTKFFLRHDKMTKEWVLIEYYGAGKERREREVMRDQSLPYMKAQLMSVNQSQKAGA